MLSYKALQEDIGLKLTDLAYLNTALRGKQTDKNNKALFLVNHVFHLLNLVRCVTFV